MELIMFVFRPFSFSDLFTPTMHYVLAVSTPSGAKCPIG